MSMKARKEAMGRQCTVDGWRRQEDGGQWASEIARGSLGNGRREQSGQQQAKGLILGCSGKVQYSTWSVHLIGVKLFARRNLFSCLHFEIISDRLLSRSFLSVVRMWNFSAIFTDAGPFRTRAFQVGRLLVCALEKCWCVVRSPNVSDSLSVLCHFVALADCIRSGYVGGQLVITRNMSFSFFTIV